MLQSSKLLVPVIFVPLSAVNVALQTDSENVKLISEKHGLMRELSKGQIFYSQRRQPCLQANINPQVTNSLTLDNILRTSNAIECAH